MPDISNDDEMRKAIDLAKSIHTPSPNETATQGTLLPIKRYESGRVEFDPTAGLLGGVTRAVTAPGRAYKGEIPEDQMLDEAINVASQVMLGSAPMGVAQTLREGFDPNVIRTFAGPSSKTADLAALDMAQNLEAKGMDRDFIWKQTGWGRNPAGQWFYEIPDNELRIRPLRIQGGNYVPRESFIGAEVHHPELFAGYPDLRGVKFKLGDIEGYGGEYTRPSQNYPELISIGTEDPREVLTHELGHAVQVREDFPRGGNPADPELVRAAAYVRQKAQEDVDRIFDFKRLFIDDYVKQSKLPKDDVYDRAMVYDLAAQRFGQLYPRESKRLEQAIKDTGFQGPTQAYTRLAGEIQPNIAMKSIDWSPIVRREIAPWHREKTPYTSQIVRRQDGTISMGQDFKSDGGRTGYAEGGDSLVDRSKLPGATLKPYEPTWKDRIANLLLGGEMPSAERERFVEGLVGSRGMGTTGMSVSDFVPLVGQALPAQEAIKHGDYKTAAMSLLPMEGGLAGQLAKAEGRALRGLTYETAQHGPFYRVSPRATGEDQPLFSRIGEKEWTESPANIGGIGQGAYGTTQSEPLTGKAAVVVPPPEQNVPFQAANQYVVDRGYTPIVQPEMPRSSLAKQSAIGRTFALALEGSPEYKASVFEAYQRAMPEVVAQSGAKNYDQLMEASYRQMAKETDDQFRRLPLRFSFHKAGEGDYENSAQMLKDVHENNHLFVFQGGSKHDYLHNIDPETGLNENEKFRAVHDAFGHAILGNTFGAQGEERAWGLHSQMYSPLARLAMTAETRGQNSFVNYTPVNMKVFDNLGQYEMQMADAISRGDKATIEELKRAKKDIMSDWQYAPQSAVLLPPEFLSTSYAGGMPEYVRGIIRPAEGTSFGSTLAHFSRNPSLVETNPALYGSGLKGAERERLFSPELQGGVTDRSYFYLGHPSRVNPERGLGPYKYVASSENLYDWSKDPAGLWAIAQELNRAPATAAKDPAWINMPQAMNDLERLVKEYGYAGVANPKHQYPMAIMFDPTQVQKVRADGGRTMGNNSVDNALRMARDHFDYGGDVRGGDSPFMSRSDYGLRSAPTPSFREAEDRSMREYNRAIESGWSPTGDRGGSDRSQPSTQSVLDQTLTGRQSGFEGAPPVAMPANIGELLGYNRARQQMMQQQQQQQSAEQEAENQRIIDALAMASMGQTSFAQSGILPSGFPPVEKQPVYWGGAPSDLPQSTIDRAMQLTQAPNVMGLPAGTTLGRTEMPLQAEMAGAPQETIQQSFARDPFSPQINAQFAMAGSPYAVTPSAPTTMFASAPMPVARPSDLDAAVQASIAPAQVPNIPLPPTVVRDPVAQAVAAATSPAIKPASAASPAADLPGVKTAEVMRGVAAPNAPMPMARPSDLPMTGLFDQTRANLDFATGQRINELEAAGQYAGGSPEQVAAALGVNPSDLRARIVNYDGQPKVDYYTKDLSQALFGDPLKALGQGVGSLFGAKTGDQQVAEAVDIARGGGGGGADRAIQQASAPVTPEAPKPPYMTELSEGNLALPSVTGQTAQEWAAANTGGDLSRVHARIKFVNGAPMLEYYTV